MQDCHVPAAELVEEEAIGRRGRVRKLILLHALIRLALGSIYKAWVPVRGPCNRNLVETSLSWAPTILGSCPAEILLLPQILQHIGVLFSVVPLTTLDRYNPYYPRPTAPGLLRAEGKPRQDPSVLKSFGLPLRGFTLVG